MISLQLLCEAWKHRDRLHIPEGVYAWLDEICRKICRRYARKQFMDQQHMFHCSPNTGTMMNIPDTHVPDPLEALNHQDVALLLDRALGSLSSKAREVVELCYL